MHNGKRLTCTDVDPTDAPDLFSASATSLALLRVAAMGTASLRLTRMTPQGSTREQWALKEEKEYTDDPRFKRGIMGRGLTFLSLLNPDPVRVPDRICEDLGPIQESPVTSSSRMMAVPQ